MEPLSEFELLFSKVGLSNVKRFSCAHIIPDENFKTYLISSYNSQYNFNFNHTGQQDPELFRYSVLLLQQVRDVMPKSGGLIVFVQSYQVLQKIKLCLEQQSVQLQYNIFYDSDHSNIMENYQQTVNSISSGFSNSQGSSASGWVSGKQSILISVMGGRLSEGINFSDNLARVIIVFGLPFANIKSQELIEKKKFLDQTRSHLTGDQYYVNLCMKQINQTIGRCLRH